MLVNGGVSSVCKKEQAIASHDAASKLNNVRQCTSLLRFQKLVHNSDRKPELRLFLSSDGHVVTEVNVVSADVPLLICLHDLKREKLLISYHDDKLQEATRGFSM